MASYNQVSYGSQGSDVKKLQELLNKNGAKLTVDGIFGSQTQKAVQEYQKANNLAVDGIVGNNTWGALTKVSTPTATTPTQTTTPWSYEEFQASQETTAADKKRQELESQKPGEFTYGAYVESDAVRQAEALLQQQLAQKPGAYQSAWQTQLDDTLQKILNREKFSYDLNGDALYQQYKDQYITQGQQAMMDTMGQAQAMTGGYGNSYAQTAGQQTYQGYLQQLNDRVPELYQLALDQYNQEGQDLYNQYGLYADREALDYGRYRDSMSDYYTELDRLTEDARYQGEQDYGRYMDAYNMAYGQHRDQVSDWQAERDRADTDYWNQYNRDYSQWADGRDFSYGQYADDRAYAYQQERDKKADEQWQAEFDEAKRQYDQQYALAAGKSSGGGSTGGNSSGGNTGGDTGGNTGGSYTKNPGYTKSEIESIQRQAGITVDGIWGPDTAAAYDKNIRPKEDGGGEPKLSAAGEKFMTKLPYAHAGSDISAWKKLVDQRLETAYNDGTLSESDVTIILKRLGLE